jgi:ankyrin repeat protein
MADPVSAKGLSASVLQLARFSGSVTAKVARFAREASIFGETKGDLFATIINFHKSLQAVQLVLDNWRTDRIPVGLVSLKVEQILVAANSILENCEEAVQRFEEKLEDFGNRSQENWLRNAMQQLKLQSRSAEMTRIKTEIDTEISTLQLLLRCLNQFTSGDIHGRIEDQLSAIISERQRTSGYRQELVRRSQYSASFSGFQNDTRLEVSTLREWNPDWETSELKAMDVKRMSRNGSVEGQTILGKNAVMPDSSRVLRNDPLSDGETVTSVDGGVCLPPGRHHLENVVSSSDYLLRRRVSAPESAGLPVEHVTTLIDEYLCSAAQDFETGSYQECENKLRLAMKRGQDRESQYGIPFDKRFQIEIKIAAVHTRQKKFGLAMKELTELQTKSNNTRLEVTYEERGELYYAIADLQLQKYNIDRNPDLLEDLGKTAERAYGLAVDLQLPSSSLLSRCVNVLRTVHLLEGDDVAARSLGQKHPTGSPALTERPLEYRQPVANPQPVAETASLSTPLSIFSSHRRNTGSFSSSQTLPSTYDTDNSLIRDVKEGNLRATELQLAIGCDTEQTDSRGRTPLLIAAKDKNTDLFLLLLNQSANVHARDSDCLTALHHALHGLGSVPIVQHLLLKNVDVNTATNEGKTPLHYCAEFDNIPAAKILLKTGKVDIEARNSKMETAAIIAANKMNTEMIKLLYDHGAEFDNKYVPRDLPNLLKRLDKGASKNRSNTSRHGSGSGSHLFRNLSWQRKT